MAISIFDLFNIGIGPSSSHTVGPMRAARRFVLRLEHQNVARVRVELFGSLGLTGRGHGTEGAVLMGLEGELPDEFDPHDMHQRVFNIKHNKKITLNKTHSIAWSPAQDIVFNRDKSLPLHPNGMQFTAYDAQGNILEDKIYYSVGGGFVIGEKTAIADKPALHQETKLAFPFTSGAQLLSLCEQHHLSIAELMLQNEQAWRTLEEIKARVQAIWHIMQLCVRRGCENSGILPGGLKVIRRAPALFAELQNVTDDPLRVLDWVNLYAIAVNEENAAGGRVVTAPTNGAAGVIPAVLHYYVNHTPNADADGILRFFLTAGAIGILYKEQASISGAEVGCQGEVGVACSMAAGGLVAAFNGTPGQIENAAEIGMEHNLGLTCDPVGGLVQIPCIERNAMGAVKAINAARMAMRGDGTHKVSLDKVIETMRQTGADMSTKYKETSRGGLAINVIEC
jgi:L-serine dehydratase